MKDRFIRGLKGILLFERNCHLALRRENDTRES
jgi:hypothetical protein